jgi:hypothetical protein
VGVPAFSLVSHWCFAIYSNSYGARIANLVVLLLGALVGAYATSNGGNGTTNSYLSNWRYEGQGQEIDYDTIVSSNFF